MIVAVGDCALVGDSVGPRLIGPRGVLRRWTAASSFARLAHPPRLAVTTERALEIVDATTGETHVVIEGAADALLAWSPDGARVFAVDDGVILAVDDDGRRTLVTGANALPPVTGLRFSRDAKDVLAVCRGMLARLERTDDDHAAVVARYHVDAAQLVVNDAFTRAAVVDGDGALSLWHLDADGGGREQSLDVAGRPAFVRVWADATLDVVITLDEAGVLRTFMTRGAPDASFRMASIRAFSADILVDAGRGRVLSCDRGAARFRTLGGVTLCSVTKARAVCFAGTNPAVVVVDGAVHVVDERGPRIVEGPGDVVAVAPHPRGVIALDSGERAHVLEIAA